MLTHAASLPEGERTKPLPPPPADLLQKLHLAAGNLGGQRGQIAANVFRPSHILPTRTLRQQVRVDALASSNAYTAANLCRLAEFCSQCRGDGLFSYGCKYLQLPLSRSPCKGLCCLLPACQTVSSPSNCSNYW